jgi:Tfp pilus assembly protein PilZ
MERRDKGRRTHRSEIGFWENASDKRHIGYCTNISSTGLYLTTNFLLPKGTRIRVEISLGGRSVVLEALVARMVRSLNNLRPSGMGIRFLLPDEVVAEVTAESARLAVAPPPPPTAPPPNIPALPLGLESRPMYPRAFVDHRQFVLAYERDLKTGGLFVPTKSPAAIGAIVDIELIVPDAAGPLCFQARVVHRLEPGAGPMAGMGVEILAFEQIEPLLRSLAEQAEPPSTTT